MATVPARYIAARAVFIVFVMLVMALPSLLFWGSAGHSSFPATREGAVGLFIGATASACILFTASFMSRSKKRYHLIMFGVTSLSVITYISCGLLGDGFGLAPFKDLKEKYASRNWRTFPVVMGGKPSICGKIFTIYNRRLSLTYPPDTMWPRTPREVGTIMYIDCRQEEFTKYYRKSDVDHKLSIPGQRWACHVALVDRGTDSVVGGWTVRGADPLESEWFERDKLPSSISGPPIEEERIRELLERVPKR